MPNPLKRTANPPDPYTQLFYEEITTRAAQRIRELRGSENLLAVMAAMVQPLHGTVEQADVGPDVAQISAALFPAAPLPKELHRRTSAFMDRWGDLEEELAHDALGDLDDIMRLSERLAAAVETA
jgi:hypothetical protein